MLTRGTVWRPHGLPRRDALQLRRFGGICCLYPDDTLNTDGAGSPEKLISTKWYLMVPHKTVMVRSSVYSSKFMWIINCNISFPACPKTLLFRCKAQPINKRPLFIVGIMRHSLCEQNVIILYVKTCGTRNYMCICEVLSTLFCVY